MGAKGVSDFLLLPLLATFFGLLIYFLGVKKEVDGGKAVWKWIGLLVVGVGAFSAWSDFALMVGIGDPAYVSMQKAQYDGKRFLVAIYGGFLIPVVSIVSSIFIGKIVVSRAKANSEEL